MKKGRRIRVENPWMAAVWIFPLGCLGAYAYAGSEGVLWVIVTTLVAVIIGLVIGYLGYRRK